MYYFWHCSKLEVSTAVDANAGNVDLEWRAVLSPTLLAANLSSTMCPLAFSTAESAG
jgi:hypothetical protein